MLVEINWIGLVTPPGGGGPDPTPVPYKASHAAVRGNEGSPGGSGLPPATRTAPDA